MTTSDTHCKELILQMVYIRQKMQELDSEHLWAYHWPKVGASDDAIQSVERRIGEALPCDYRAFLRHADGWPAFYQAVDLFGTGDLLGGRQVSACDANA